MNGELVLSVFPGIDLFGMAFENIGFCVVRGPDLIFGGDVRTFHPAQWRFDGVIGGPPCQDFSRARRGEKTGQGMMMLEEFKRIVLEAYPLWWVMENVPSVPDLEIAGYSWERLDVAASMVGNEQERNRHFQVGTRDGTWIINDWQEREEARMPALTASDGRRGGRLAWADFCRGMGLDEPLDLPGWTMEGKYRAVGNGVTMQQGRAIARAVNDRRRLQKDERVCACLCGRLVTGRERCAGVACRKRVQRRRDRSKGVTWPAEIGGGVL